MTTKHCLNNNNKTNEKQMILKYNFKSMVKKCIITKLLIENNLGELNKQNNFYINKMLMSPSRYSGFGN